MPGGRSRKDRAIVATQGEGRSNAQLLTRAEELRSQAKRARRLADGFPFDGDRELLLAQARDLEAKVSEIEKAAAEAAARERSGQ